MNKQNRVITSKYTLATFLPLNLYHQLSRPSNLYFLVTLILLTIPSISPFSPYTYLLAFFIVIGMSMIKDGMEDYKRHKHDKLMNRKPAYRIFNYSVEQIYVEDLRVGDFIVISKNQEVPGDVVLLRSKVTTKKGIECKNFCFIETSNLDGESNLKRKNAHHSIDCSKVVIMPKNEQSQSQRTSRELLTHENRREDDKHETYSTTTQNYNSSSFVRCDKGASSYENNASTRITSTVNSNANMPNSTTSHCLDDKQSHVSIESQSSNMNLNPSSCNINANSDSTSKYSSPYEYIHSSPIHALDLCDCDIHYINNVRNLEMRDTGDVFNKFECSLQIDNQNILCNEKNVLLRGSRLKNTEQVLAMVVCVGTDTKLCKSQTKSRKRESIFERELSKIILSILCLYILLLSVSSILGSNFVKYQDIAYLYLHRYLTREAIKQTGTNYIMYSYLIPLSLYVTLEISRMFHASYIENDTHMQIRDLNSVCRNSNVTEDIGIIEYLLTDKTGTITKNNMVFKYCHFYNKDTLISSDRLNMSKLDIEQILKRKITYGINEVEDSHSNYIEDHSESNVSGTCSNYGENSHTFSLQGMQSVTYNSMNASVGGFCDGCNSKNGKACSCSQTLHNSPILSENSTRQYSYRSSYKLRPNRFVINTQMNSENTMKFMYIIGLLCCNSVEPLNNKYEGISQDELCIVEELDRLGYSLLDRDETYVILNLQGKLLKCYIHSTLDFSSSRQRQSVIVEIKKTYFLFTKGSDQKLKEKEMEIVDIEAEKVFNLINRSSEFRSLVIGYKKLTKHQVNDLKIKINNINLVHRHVEEEKIFNDIERKLIYLGTTFIEDQLQDSVRDTMKSLVSAGIKIWMITGDKRETAISCARDCGIMAGSRGIVSNVSFVDDNSARRHRSRGNEDGNQDLYPCPICDPSLQIASQQSMSRDSISRTTSVEATTLVIEGDKFVRDMQDSTVLKYHSVVIYRATPHQKSRIARNMVKMGRSTLAIGDGNNDVGMLDNAHVGVGIMGNEGTQASLTADFAIPEFKFLKRLILVHGRYNFMRFSKVTINAFYKNIFFIAIQFFYNFFNGHSGKPVYNGFFLNYYNVIFTSLIPASIALFDKDLREDYIMANPEEYSNSKYYLSRSVVLLSFSFALLQAVLVFCITVGITYTKDLVSSKGFVGGYVGLSNLFAFMVLFSVLIEQVHTIGYFVFYSYVAIFLSVFMALIVLFFVQGLNKEYLSATKNLFTIPVFYMNMLCVLSLVYLVVMLHIEIRNYLQNKKLY